MGMLNHHFAAAACSAQSDSLPLTAANLCNRARRGGLRAARFFSGTLERAQEGLVLQVMATHDTAPWSGRMRVLRKNPEPRPGMPGARILPLKGVGKRNAAAALGLVLQPPCPCTRQLLAQAGCQALG